jgi:holo-[acyl-carrier protein] synthase
MIVGMGIDLVRIERIKDLLERHGERARGKLFTAGELADCDERIDPSECLAARFAAKEAAFKALGSGKVPGIQWTEIEVRRAGSGYPSLNLSGGARSHADRLGVERTWVSLSHEAGLACAIVILEGRDL